jgi:hypothetical protein
LWLEGLLWSLAETAAPGCYDFAELTAFAKAALAFLIFVSFSLRTSFEVVQ